MIIQKFIPYGVRSTHFTCRIAALVKPYRVPRVTRFKPYTYIQRRGIVLSGERHILNSSSKQIRHLLDRKKHTKWGFVIYRCTYEDDAAWETLLSILKERTHGHLKREDSLDLEDKLEWTVIEDKEKLDGANVGTVGDMFLNWVESEEAKHEQLMHAGEPEMQPGSMLGITPRYLCCVHVGAESLNSVVNLAPRPPEPDLWHTAYVNMIHAPSWIQRTEVCDYEGGKNDTEGWTKISADLLIPHAYACLQSLDGWYAVWARPPLVSTLPSYHSRTIRTVRDTVDGVGSISF
ncbi:uncharacterized protein CIMG_00794 [Coccidioides immitis RS]|uniref:Uncharacterized protein n=4 Tax=Coccidioides immitis TaxID=5501 RepID=J3KHS0_COCIM|nr:uncharacterized protein CIMG_00794 [Coccidioides immitis RS]KMP00686.1 hypothetical protein CIRG_00828 [Coccidioides immitis RMSCC 2394]KMU78196.1 hypothetical protein CISG_07036 [Coccidioides immitis RMSCC 3703]KMU85348.1 hypothetical protein CIHG_03132 [Coccidioides immitis H538.4]TPX26299.1 hypothetical protein DIZ76_011761 [Coccidioides immitis]EAS35440.3 hypothetical protein CIMG_00794 [Coccidioides immitis RS]